MTTHNDNPLPTPAPSANTALEQAPVMHRHTITLDVRSTDPGAAIYVRNAIRGAFAMVQKGDTDSGRAATLTTYELVVPFPVPMFESKAPRERLDENEDDPTVLWAEIHRLRAEARGPDGYDTWREAAVAERIRRVDAEQALLSGAGGTNIAQFDSWAIRLDTESKVGWVRDSFGQPALYSESQAKSTANAGGKDYSAHQVRVTYTSATDQPGKPIAQVRREHGQEAMVWLGEIPADGTNLYCGHAQPTNDGMPATQEPKYGIRHNMVYNRMSRQFIPFDEPIFIFRARDIHAIAALSYYAHRIGAGEHRDAVIERIGHFREFAQWYPERMKKPDTAALSSHALNTADDEPIEGAQ